MVVQQERGAAALMALLSLRPGESPAGTPRVMVVAAHPDDESVGAGSRLARLAGAQFVYVTDGAPQDGGDAAALGLPPVEYRALRQRELAAALALCGVAPAQVRGLDCPDQEASSRLLPLTKALARLLLHAQPEAVLTHAYEGGHPDHDASAFAVHAAVALLRRAGAAAPAIVEMSCYHRGARGLRAGTFLPAPPLQPTTVRLTPAEQRHKRALFDCFASQRDTLRWFPLEAECFRPAPAYDFRQAPHAGALFYESFAWGTSGERFRALAGQAMAQLALEGPL